MSKMKDLWGDTIEFLPGHPDGSVEVVFHVFDEGDMQSMVFDRKTARQFINKFLKALEEVA